MPGRAKTKRKVKTKLSTAEKQRRWRAIFGLFPKNATPDPIKWIREGRRDRKII